MEVPRFSAGKILIEVDVELLPEKRFKNGNDRRARFDAARERQCGRNACGESQTAHGEGGVRARINRFREYESIWPIPS